METDLMNDMNPVAEALRRLASKHPEVVGWEVVGLRRFGEQRLADGGPGNSLRLMQSRHEIEERTLSVQVYVSTGPEAMGTAGATLDPHGDPIETQLESLLPSARAGANPPWVLPGPTGEHPRLAPQMEDPDFSRDPGGFMDRLLADADGACRRLTGARVESAELYGDLLTRTVLTHTGLHWSERSSEFYFEAAFEADPPRKPYNTQEIHEAVRSIRGQDLDLPGFIARCGASASRLGQTVVAPSLPQTHVLVGGEALAQLLHALMGHLDMGSEYYRRPHLKVGQAIYDGPLLGDGVTLTLDPFLDFMALSGAHTRDGLPAAAGAVVEGGKVVARTGSHRMAQYLGQPTPRLTGNLVLAPGSRTKAGLLSGTPDVFEIEAFSSLLISGDTLTWSSEISRGLRHTGGRTEAIKGGVMSGNLKKNLASALFSSEPIRYNRTADAYHAAIGYTGPAFALFTEGVSISGK